MSDQIKRVAFYRVPLDGDVGGGAAIVNAVLDSGVKLLAFSELPEGPGGSQLDLLPESDEVFEMETKGMGLAMSKRAAGFLFTGEDPPDAVTEAVNKLVQAGIAVTSLQYVSAGEERYGAVICVNPPDADRAAGLLHASETEPVQVEEASEESFLPAAAPVWVPAG